MARILTEATVRSFAKDLILIQIYKYSFSINRSQKVFISNSFLCSFLVGEREKATKPKPLTIFPNAKNTHFRHCRWELIFWIFFYFLSTRTSSSLLSSKMMAINWNQVEWPYLCLLLVEWSAFAFSNVFIKQQNIYLRNAFNRVKMLYIFFVCFCCKI